MFTSSALLSQGLNSNHKRERRACVFCGLSNHKSRKYWKVTNPSARKEICKKSKNCFVCFEIGHNANSCTPEKIINVKTVMANILLVFVLLIKINYNPDLITWIILLPIIWQTTKLAFCRKLRSWKSAIYIYKNNLKLMFCLTPVVKVHI